MACEICGRNSCTRSFHSLDEQETFDNIADGVKDRMRQWLKNKIDRLPDEGSHETKVLVDASAVLFLIDDY